MSPWMESTMRLSRLVGREEVMLLQIFDRLPDVRLREILFIAQEDRPQPDDVQAFRLPGPQQEMHGGEQFQAARARLGRDGLEQLAQMGKTLQRTRIEFPVLQFV